MAQGRKKKNGKKDSSAGKRTGSSHARSARKSSPGSSRKRTSSRQKSTVGTSARTKRQKTYTDYQVSVEIRIVVMLAVCVMLFAGNLGFIGMAGRVISEALFGAFGLLEWAFPVILFFGFSFYMANSLSPGIWRRMIGLVLAFVFAAALFQMFFYGYSSSDTPVRYYAVAQEERIGGGFLGSCIVCLFGRWFGEAGVWILTAFGLVISVILLTQRPIFSDMRSRRRRSAARRREKKALNEKYKERAARERRERFEAEDDEDLEDYEPADPRSPFERAHLAEESWTEGKKKKRLPEKEPNRKKTELSAGTEDSSFTMPDFLKGAGDHAEASDTTIAGSEGVEDLPIAMNTSLDGAYGTDGDGSDAEGKDSVEQGEEAGETDKMQKVRRQTKEEKEKAVEGIALEVAEKETPKKEYILPSSTLLARGRRVKGDSKQHIMETAEKLQKTLQTFGVNVRLTGISPGPTVTRYELQPEMGVKVSRIINLQDDIKLNLAAEDIRIEAPIPGKAAVGIEVPNKEVTPVLFRDLIESDEFRNTKATLAFAVGKDISGRPVVADIEKMPHLLIAGATGSGKSVCINSLIMSILFKKKPDEVRLLMIDPKVVELKIYDGIPHLLIPVVTDPKKAAGALNWAVQEMTNRYNEFQKYPGVRDIRAYNKRIEEENFNLPDVETKALMPRIIVIVDELADLMMVAGSEVEDAIVRLTQLARAAGIHLIVATQRPSVNVVTGLIKANMPSRIALAVTSGVDSRTILDMNGAEKLLGHGDMLFYPQGYPKPARLQGAYASDADITKVVKFIISQNEETEYNTEIEEQIANGAALAAGSAQSGDSDVDEYFAEAGRLIIEKDKASIGMLQRAFKIGFNRAARIMDQLADAGVVGGEEGTKPRKILMSSEEFEEYIS